MNKLTYWKKPLTHVRGSCFAVIAVAQSEGSKPGDEMRQDAVLRSMREANEGPLSDAAVESVYQAIMAAMRELQARD